MPKNMSAYPSMDHDPSAYMYLEHYDDFMNICCFGEGMGNKDYAEVKREWKKAGRPKRPKEVKEAQEKERIRSFVESYCHKL